MGLIIAPWSTIKITYSFHVIKQFGQFLNYNIWNGSLKAKKAYIF